MRYALLGTYPIIIWAWGSPEKTHSFYYRAAYVWLTFCFLSFLKTVYGLCCNGTLYRLRLQDDVIYFDHKNVYGKKGIVLLEMDIDEIGRRSAARSVHSIELGKRKPEIEL